MDFDFAVAPQSAEGSAAPVPTMSAEQDMMFWQSIMNSVDPADFEAYLKQFPQGVFRALAQNRLAAMAPSGSEMPAAGRAPADYLRQEGRDRGTGGCHDAFRPGQAGRDSGRAGSRQPLRL